MTSNAPPPLHVCRMTVTRPPCLKSGFAAFGASAATVTRSEVPATEGDSGEDHGFVAARLICLDPPKEMADSFIFTCCETKKQTDF